MKVLKYNLDIIYYLILTLPIWAIFSILILELNLIIISIMFIYQSYKEKNFSYFNNSFFVFFLVFYFYILLNYIIQVKNFNTLSIIFYFRYGIYTIALYYFLLKKKNLFSLFLKLISLIVVILFIDSIFQYFTKKNIIGLEIQHNYRVSSFFGDELILGSYIFKIIPFIFIYTLFNKFFFKNTILLFMCVIIVFLSGERLSLLAFLIFFILNIVFVFQKKKFFNYKKLIISAIIFLVIFFSYSKDYYFRYIVQPIKDISISYDLNNSLLDGFKEKPKFIFFSGLHHNLMVTSLRIFEDNKIFGSGPRSYRYICEDYKLNRFSCDNHPHNFYFQILSETGLIGFSFLLFLYFLIIKKIINLFCLKSNLLKPQLIILFYYLTVLIPFFPSGNFFNNWLNIMIFLPFSFYLYLDKNNK